MRSFLVLCLSCCCCFCCSCFCCHVATAMDALHIWMLFINLFARIHTHKDARPLILLCFLEICIVPLPIELAQSHCHVRSKSISSHTRSSNHPHPSNPSILYWRNRECVSRSTKIYRAAFTFTCWDVVATSLSPPGLHVHPKRHLSRTRKTRRCIDLFVLLSECACFSSALVIFESFSKIILVFSSANDDLQFDKFLL